MAQFWLLACVFAAGSAVSAQTQGSVNRSLSSPQLPGRGLAEPYLLTLVNHTTAGFSLCGKGKSSGLTTTPRVEVKSVML